MLIGQCERCGKSTYIMPGALCLDCMPPPCKVCHRQKAHPCFEGRCEDCWADKFKDSPGAIATTSSRVRVINQLSKEFE